MIVTIDGVAVQVGPGTSVLEAALAQGTDVPRLCYHPTLRPSGGCRLCIVEVEGRPRPTASCSLLCEDGMVVRTESEQLTRLRRGVLELFISDHPLRCFGCDKCGACDLQRYAYRYGVTGGAYPLIVSRSTVERDNPFFIRDHEMCILCGRCVRVCDEVVGANAIDLAGRGFTTYVATSFDQPLAETSCVFCGSCVQVCPTAALLPVARLGKGREWELTRRRTVCGYCGVGCRLEYATKDGQILYTQGFPEAPANGELLCAKGRFGWDFATSPDRLTQPLVRRNGELQPTDWGTALDLVADRLAGIVARDGPDAVAGLASARCTNEENYLFQKLLRASIGTNNVDHCARLCHASSVAGLGMAFGSGAMSNQIREIRDADCILITGSNTAESHPVIGYEVVRAAKSGANVLIIDPRRIPLVDHATLFLQPRPGSDLQIFLAMAHVIVREGWADLDFVRERTENFAAFRASLEGYPPAVAALASGVPAEQIERAARLYALGQRAAGGTSERGRSTILYAMGITQRRNGTDLVLSLANLALLSGQIGRASTGVNPLRGQSNVQGACDLGCLPNVLPGYRPVTDPSVRQAVAAGWGVADLPATPGLTVVEMMHAAADGRVKAMYVMGENPMLSDPNIRHVAQALRALDFLVVQDIFLSETAELADVVLPAASWLEKDGTKTNTERRVQEVAPILTPPGLARPDWQIVTEIGARLDARLGRRQPDGWTYGSTAEILVEAAGVTPIYGGIRRERLGEEGLVWPCPSLDHPGTPILHLERFTRGRGRFHPVHPQPPAELPDAEFPFVLSTGRSLYHYHTATMTRRSTGLNWREPGGYVEINEDDARRAGIADGDLVAIRGRRGQIHARARVGWRVQPGMVFVPFHWAEAPANLLIQDAVLDPVAKIPEYKVGAVQLIAIDPATGETTPVGGARAADLTRL